MYTYTKQYMQALYNIEIDRDIISQRRATEKCNSGRGGSTINNTVPLTFPASQNLGNNTNNK